MTPLPAPSVAVARPPSFPLLKEARRRFAIAEPRFVDILMAREVAAKLNATRDLEAQPQLAVKGGLLAGASLLDEVFAHIIALYVEEVAPRALEEAPGYLATRVGTTETGSLFTALQDGYEAPAPRAEALEYALRLQLANANPALGVAAELFDDAVLPEPIYDEAQTALYEYFDALPPFGPDAQNLLDMLLAPLRAHPDSIEKQLRFLVEQWGRFAEPFVRRILLQLDVLSEENKPTFFGPGPALVPDYKNRAVGHDEYEAFSRDKAWMPEVVLMAKNTYVWLDQLSKKFGRHIYRLDQVPDEELDEMAARGFTGLWLIGLWQRSQASQRIKQMCGNPDAVASAYSLHAYDISWELGGQEAMDNLASRAARRGLRMASDMVPNHMAIDSRWVIEHPDWFLSLPHSPYPQYSFEGPDLSEDGRVGIFLENHYYSKSDAAVVFKRVDRESGEERYIYHGNDGTSMPWNDTAQLNYLMPQVREAVVQTILHVARHFPIIRFDAAMTLAKRHYHRLWFPSPGEGGAIPTRAGQGLTPDEFDRAFPQEFWREVVERVAQEVPDTLLLAEAFWMMEGYFVRTLGMHRVYNSAFMNMARDEKNAEYRLLMKNTLEFDGDILGRFVNFMNNPDEKTAVEQFGKGDKYFGVCTLMATLPGLPMFGHGQIEGYEEKYGMEYPRAYWDERPDEGLIAHHERTIFPLLHRRALFAGSENFTLFDFWTNEGYVNEDVFAYSNRRGEERALVVYHNRFADAAGWIKTSVGFAQKGADGERTLLHRSLAEALGLVAGERLWAIFRDNANGLEYLRRSRDLDENGLFVQLSAYGCHVFLDWREVQDASGLYELLAARLDGRGVSSVETALREIVLEPLRTAFRPLVEDELWRGLLSPATPAPITPAGRTAKSRPKPKSNGIVAASGIAAATGIAATQVIAEPDSLPSLEAFEAKLRAFGQAASEFCDLEGDVNTFAARTLARLGRVLSLLRAAKAGKSRRAGNEVASDPALPGALWGWGLLSQIGLLGVVPEAVPPAAIATGENGVAMGKEVASHETDMHETDMQESDMAARSRLWLDEWLLVPMLEEALRDFGIEPSVAARAGSLTRLLTAHAGSANSTPFALISALMSDESLHPQLGINRFEGVTWFDKAGFENVLEWLQFAAAIEGGTLPVAQLKKLAVQSSYRVVRLLELSRAGSANPKKVRAAGVAATVR